MEDLIVKDLMLMPDPSATEVAVADFARDYRRMLIMRMSARASMLGTNTVKTLLDNSPPTIATLSAAEGRVYARCLQDAEVVLWRTDLLLAAHAQAEAFTDVAVPADLLPMFPQLWIPYGEDQLYIRNVDAIISSILLVPRTHDYLAVCLAHPRDVNNVLLGTDLYILDGSRLVAGREAESQSAREFFASLSFMHSTVASSEPMSQPRHIQRRQKREGLTSPIHIVRLRRKERESNEDTHLSEREYQCQWIVRTHVRKPSPRMKEQRPVWVSAYVKGPDDKPLKPPTPAVTVVNR